MASESLISWDESLSALDSMLPDANSFALNKICDVAEGQGFKIEWLSLSDWEKLDDATILDSMLGEDVIRGSSQGILLPSMCFFDRQLPFSVCHDGIKDFVSRFVGRYGECFFNGDSIILLPSLSTIYLLHHEGLYAKIVAQK